MFDTYGDVSRQVKDTNGFNQLFAYFRGEISLDEAIKLWKISEIQLAREQLKWVKTRKDIVLFDPSEKSFDSKALAWVKEEFGI